MMTIEQALEFIHSVTWQGGAFGLERIQTLLAQLGNPQDVCPMIHIAGTNGKGSTAAMLASVLASAGYRTGLYTSPYITRFHERIQINGEEISDEALIQLTQEIYPYVQAMPEHPSEFELVTTLAFLYFKQQKCDFVVLEVGMGGRYDATNIITQSECSVITAIGLDHVAELGDTLPQIAREKAGIIKSGCPVVLYQQAEEVMDAVAQIASEKNAPLFITEPATLKRLKNTKDGQTFSYGTKATYTISLLGNHQLQNAATVLKVLEILQNKGHHISQKAIQDGLYHAAWPARFEVLCKDPYFIIDGGHNPQCAETVRENLSLYFPDQPVIFLLGVLKDKDYAGLVAQVDPLAAAYVTITPNIVRALPAEELAQYLQTTYQKDALACNNVQEAVETAMKKAKEIGGVVCAVGSLYMAGSVRGCFQST